MLAGGKQQILSQWQLTAQHRIWHKRKKGVQLRVRGCSYSSSALTVLPRLQEVLSLTEKSGSLVVVNSSLFPWASGPHISEVGPKQPMCPQKTHRPHSCPWKVGALELCHLPGHINCPYLKNNTAHFPLSSLSFTKRKKPNARVVRKLLCNDVMGGSRIIPSHGTHNWQAFQRPHGCIWLSKTMQSQCEPPIVRSRCSHIFDS